MNNIEKKKCDNCKKKFKSVKYLTDKGTFCSWECDDLYKKIDDHCIVCAASDCEVVKENEQLKEIIKATYYIGRNNILTTDYFTKKYYKIKDKYNQLIIDILEGDK